jgi:hypothetical protein
MRRSTSGHLDAWRVCCFQVYNFFSHTDWTYFQIFEITIGNALFEYKPYPKYALDATTAHLWQMLCFTRERITREQVTASELGAQYFDLAVNPDDVDNPFCLSSLPVS